MPTASTDLTEAKIAEIVEGGRAEALAAIEHDYAWSMYRCESPIEKLFASAIVTPSTAAEYNSRVELLNPPSGKIEHCVAPPVPGIYLWQQINIGAYRVDFLFDSYPGRGLPPLVVECDGHDFHERTKEQAQRDKARDRFLVARGLRILRFTGSEIFRDPFATAHEALQILQGIAD